MISMGPRGGFYLLIVIAAGGFLLRVASLLGAGGPLASPTGYDDGVYFSASALLFEGVIPYRDFVFVHPPGVLYFFGLTSWGALFDPAAAFIAARFLAALVGAANIMLAGAVVMRSAGVAAGLVAAFLYAIHPDAIVAEQSPYLEPVLNLACLAFAFAWLRPREDGKRPVIVAALFLAFACATKVLGGIWLIAAIASAARGRFRTDLPTLIGTSAVAGMLLLAPFALTNIDGFVEQTLLFHAWRPPDGLIGAAARVPQMIGGVHVVPSFLAAIALVMMVARRSSMREERFFAVATVLTLVAFLASSSYWAHYNSHLAASQCTLAGFGAAALARAAGTRQRVASAAVAALAVVFSVPTMRQTIERARARAPEQIAVGRAIRSVVAPVDCVFAFDPTWTLIGGRLPPHDDGAPVVVDSYGAMLLEAVEGGAKYRDTAAAFEAAPVHRDVRARMEVCRYAVIDWRARWQMNEKSRAWAAARYLCVTPEAGDLCVSERLAAPFSGLTLAPSGGVEFVDGWFAEEGASPNPWRWMGAQSAIKLPPLEGEAELTLSLYVPLEQLEAAPHVTVEVNGEPIDRFAAVSSEVTRSYRVKAAEGTHSTLIMSTDRVFRPSAAGPSTDSRELGLSLKRLVWRRAPSAGPAAATSSRQ